jgi:hypothetical protein
MGTGVEACASFFFKICERGIFLGATVSLSLSLSLMI